MKVLTFLKKLVRKKVLSDDEVKKSDLKRCLTTVDLTFLGIGCTLGAGLYVVAGEVAHKKAGPSIIIAFLVAAIASAFAGLCYAEFAARIPRAGSAYVYSYVTVGEFMAFIIGWNLVLEYVIGTASVARGWSGYVNALVDNQISDFFNRTMPIQVSQLSAYPDFFAFGMTILVTGLVGFGVKESTQMNTIFTTVNLMVVLYVIVCGLFQVDWHNWNLSKDEIPDDAGSGGFMPFGFSGTMAGAASCFYAFVGFDAIATTGEEAKNPQKSIPISIILSLLFIFLSYFGVSMVMTLMCPYYLLDVQAPLPDVFKRVGWGVAGYIISAGAIAGLSTSLIGALFPLPRVLYAMGNDGVLFHFMGKVSPRFQTPLIGTAVSGVFAGLMAMLFDLGELVDMMSIGTLLAYTLVALSVLILRYERIDEDYICMVPQTTSFKIADLFFPTTSQPTILTSQIVKATVGVLCCIITVFSAFIIFGEKYLLDNDAWAIIIAVILGLFILLCCVVMHRQPQSSVELPFTVPFLPYLPALSAFINIYLMLKLSSLTWIRFGVWMFIGFLIYFGYGIRHSKENNWNPNGSLITQSALDRKGKNYFSTADQPHGSLIEHEEDNGY